MKALRRLFGYLRPHLGRLVVASIMLALAALLMSAVVATLKPLANEVFRLGAEASASVPAVPAAATQRFDILETVKQAIPTASILRWARDRAYLEVPLL